MFVKIVFIHCLNTKWNIYFQLLGINMYLYFFSKKNVCTHYQKLNKSQILPLYIFSVK